MRSAVYEGTVAHHRHGPVDHRFTYRLTLPLLDLDEIDEVCALHPLWSAERRNVVSFRRADFLGGGPGPLADAVRDLVEERLGHRPTGPVALLAHLRTWGWLFNPIALYYCFDPTGRRVEALVADVTNTPWHERHSYVVAAPGRHHFAKELHVSPFFGMEHRYQLDYDEPGERLVVHLGNDEGDRRVFDAVLRLDRTGVSHRSLGRVITAHPFLTARISAGIYRQAAALHRAGVPLVAHPGRPRTGRPVGAGPVGAPPVGAGPVSGCPVAGRAGTAMGVVAQ